MSDIKPAEGKLMDSGALREGLDSLSAPVLFNRPYPIIESGWRFIEYPLTQRTSSDTVWLVPEGLHFNIKDKKLSFIEDPNLYETVTRCMPIPCVDVFLTTADEPARRLVLTVTRTGWPLDGFRWMIGGRRVMPPLDHPLHAEWNHFYDALLVLYREAGVNPADVGKIYPLTYVEHFFSKSVKTEEGEEIVYSRCTPSFTCVATLRSAKIPELTLDRTVSEPVWLSKTAFSDPKVRAVHCNFMCSCLERIFNMELE